MRMNPESTKKKAIPLSSALYQKKEWDVPNRFRSEPKNTLTIAAAKKRSEVSAGRRGAPASDRGSGR